MARKRCRKCRKEKDVKRPKRAPRPETSLQAQRRRQRIARQNALAKQREDRLVDLSSGKSIRQSVVSVVELYSEPLGDGAQ